MRTKDKWIALILEAYNSGIEITKWCRQNSIGISVFYYMKKILTDNGDIPSDIYARTQHKKRRTKDECKALYTMFLNSSIKLSEWCRRNNINPLSFYSMRKRLIDSGHISTNELYHMYKKRRTKDEWKALIINAYKSDTTISEWCRQNNINPSHFHRMKATLINEGYIPSNIIHQKQIDKRSNTSNTSEHTKSEETEVVFCELPILENCNIIDSQDIKGNTFRVGKFSLSVEEDVSEDMLNAALEALNTVMEVFGND